MERFKVHITDKNRRTNYSSKYSLSPVTWHVSHVLCPMGSSRICVKVGVYFTEGFVTFKKSNYLRKYHCCQYTSLNIIYFIEKSTKK